MLSDFWVGVSGVINSTFRLKSLETGEPSRTTPVYSET
jgi:hypothetical protein